MTPAGSAYKLLMGTGLGLLFATGLGFISGSITIDRIGVAYLIPMAGLISIFLGNLTKKGEGPLSKLFPVETEFEMKSRVEADLMINKNDDNIGNAWARLEHSMLSKELGEQE